MHAKSKLVGSRRLLLVACCLLLGWSANPCLSDDGIRPLDRKLAQAAQQQIAAYHRDQPKSAHPIRVVYFHAFDREPLPKWQERLTRILKDVERFYHEGIAATGVPNAHLKFETDDEQYVFHRVQGKGNSDDYNYESGRRVVSEIEGALQGKIDLSKEHVLIIHGLCDKNEKGEYAFHAPYYGSGSGRRGICHAADCELLDPQQLTVSFQKIVYSEHYYPRKEQTIGRFNSWYIGGIAHELGHALGLPHDAARRTPGRPTRYSLMGMGNHHYREELHGGKQPAYLSIGSILRLLSHPTITGSDHGRFEPPKTRLSSLSCKQQTAHALISGHADGDVPPYAVIAYLWRPESWPGNPKSDHRSNTEVAGIENGQFQLKLPPLSAGDYRLRLGVLHCNGASSNYDFHLIVRPDGESNLNELPDQILITQAEQQLERGDLDWVKQQIDEKRIAAAQSSDAAIKLRILQNIATPSDPVTLSTTQQNRVSLSDARWESADVGWGKVARNHYELKGNLYLMLKDSVFEKGLYAHSESDYTFRLDGQWKSLSATIGLQQGALPQGSAVFRVIADGRELYQSPVMKAGQSEEFRVDLTDVDVLQLTTEGGEGHVHNSWAIWANPFIQR